jgi:hypothetical protein
VFVQGQGVGDFGAFGVARTGMARPGQENQEGPPVALAVGVSTIVPPDDARAEVGGQNCSGDEASKNRPDIQVQPAAAFICPPAPAAVSAQLSQLFAKPDDSNLHAPFFAADSSPRNLASQDEVNKRLAQHFGQSSSFWVLKQPGAKKNMLLALFAGSPAQVRNLVYAHEAVLHQVEQLTGRDVQDLFRTMGTECLALCEKFTVVCAPVMKALVSNLAVFRWSIEAFGRMLVICKRVPDATIELSVNGDITRAQLGPSRPR